MLLKSLALVALSVLTLSANAALYDRGNGLIYDDVLDITWLQDANYAKTSGYDEDGRMSWNDAASWADQLIFAGYTDWRMADITPRNDSGFNEGFTLDGSTDRGFNITSETNEMAHLFYSSLGNFGYYETDGAESTCYNSNCLVNTSMFVNIKTNKEYWYQAESIAPNNAFHFAFGNGKQNRGAKDNQLYAWAVADGDIANTVPIPAAAWLFGSALVGLFGIGRNRKQAS